MSAAMDIDSFVPSVEADASPRESAMAGAACREVGRPEDGDEDGDDSSYYEYLSENPRKAAETIERLETQVEELKAIRRSQIAEIERLRAGLGEDQIEQFARRIQAIAERWKGANGGIYTIRAMALDMAHTLAEERAISVSDGSLKGQDAERLDPTDDSAVGCKAAETPLPLPVAGIVERLTEVVADGDRRGVMAKLPTSVSVRNLLEEAATALQSLSQSLASAEKERDEARALLAAADRGSPVYAAVERVLDEESAWIARPNAEVTKRVALVAAIACDLAFGAEMRKALDGEDAAKASLASKDAEIERLTKERDESVKQERESCAFDAERVSGLGDPWTIETIAANIRARGPEDERELVHVTREAYEEFLALRARIAEMEEALEDKARLDFLDECNARLNAHYGTTYRWQMVMSHNVTRLMLGHMVVDLNDADGSNRALPSCRGAIDAARLARQGAKP